MTVSPVNLMPAARLRARQTRSRIAVWLWVVPVCCGLLVVAYLCQRFAGESDTKAVQEVLAEVAGKIKQTDARFVTQNKELREARSNLQANKAVGEQPDWSVLLGLVTEKLGEEAALSSLKLEPVEQSVAAARNAKETAGPLAGGGRPEKLKLTMKGVAKSQEAASRLVLELEGAPFDRVSLVEAKRTEAGIAGEIVYQIVCELSDPGGGAPAPVKSAAGGEK